MMNPPIIPENYEQWRHCIVELCKQPLTSDYIDARIKALNDMNDFTTRKFIELYGQRHHLNTLQWFKEAQKKINT